MVQSAVGAALLLIALAIYQAALALGAPWGESAFSANPETGDKLLLPGYRVVSAVTAAMAVGSALVVAARADVIGSGRLTDGLLGVLTWFISGYLLLDAIVNISSASAMKRWLGSAVKVVISACCVIVALEPI
jgi:hypothetical protein